MKRVLSVGEGERERECVRSIGRIRPIRRPAGCHDPEGARFSHVREPERASTRVSVEYRGEKDGAPPLLVSRPVRGALLLVLAPTGPIVPAAHYRHYHEFHRLLRLCRAAPRKWQPSCVHPTVRLINNVFELSLLRRLHSTRNNMDFRDGKPENFGRHFGEKTRQRHERERRG